jgi:hypothetical protein
VWILEKNVKEFISLAARQDLGPLLLLSFMGLA